MFNSLLGFFIKSEGKKRTISAVFSSLVGLLLLASGQPQFVDYSAQLNQLAMILAEIGALFGVTGLAAAGAKKLNITK